MQIPLTALLLCNDTQALGTIERILEDYGIPTFFCQNSKAAQSSLNRRKFDLVVLDFDEPGAEELVDFHAMDSRGIPSVLIVLANDPGALKQVLRRRVHFTMQKPVIGDLIVRTLKAAYSKIVAEKRISFRHAARIKADASVLDENTRRPLGPTLIHDVSHTGLGLQTESTIPRDSTIFVDFELPEEGEQIHTIGKVIWADAQGHLGVQFRFIAPLELRSLQAWLGAHYPWDVELEPRITENVYHLAAGAGSGSRSGTIQ
jgi:CheY-like chemotaxis protein